MHSMIRKLSRAAVMLSSAAVLACAMLPTAQAEEEKVLNIYHWSDYIAPDTIANFERETGIKVRFDTFDSNETLHTKLVAGRTGYDIVVPGSHFAKLQIEAGLFLPLDPSKIPNLSNLNPAIQAQLARVDPGNKYLVDWMWGYTTVGINVDQVKAALGNMPMPENAWDLVFKPEYASKLRSCGIAMLDTASEILPIALRYVGKNPYSSNADDYKAAADMLRAIRPNISRFVSSGSDYIDQLATGGLCAVVGWSGDMMISANKSRHSSKPQNIEILLPKMGGLLFFDTMAIPKDAPHPENAMKWINYILQPQVQASLTNAVFYANPTWQVSLQYVNPEIASNKAVFPSDAEVANMIAPNAMDLATRRLVTRTFSNFKASR